MYVMYVITYITYGSLYMSERSIIETQITKKNNEIQSLEERLKTAKIYLKALNDIIKALDKGGDSGNLALRSGSLVAQARDAIISSGNPIHIDDLLRILGKEVTRETKASLTSSIAAYVRKGEIFTRPVASTFGLVELNHHEVEAPKHEPPQGFGDSSEENDEIPF